MLSLALTSCLAVHAENKNQNTDKPNVIFIYADDLGYQRTRYRRYQYPIQIFHADRRICMA